MKASSWMVRTLALAVFGSLAAFSDVSGQSASWQMANIGRLIIPDGGVYLASENGTAFNLRAAGGTIGNDSDSCFYVYQTLEGDGEIVGAIGTVLSDFAWLMMRETVEVNSKCYATRAYYNKPNFTPITLARAATPGFAEQTTGTTDSGQLPVLLRLARRGNAFTSYYSKDGGKTWVLTGSREIAMSPKILVGMASDLVSEESWVTFTSVAVTRPSVAVPPVIAEQPRNIVVREGEPWSLAVVANGTPPLNYQWYSDKGIMLGFVDPALALGPARASHEGTYWVNVINEAGAVQSTKVTVTVIEGPVIENKLSIAVLPVLELTGTVGLRYSVQFASDLTGATGWTSLTNIILTSSPQHWIDFSARGQSKRYYRTVTVP